ncbi:chloride channel protein [Agaribacter marinus]|uniref:Chloride channel protein n=1 Tax=Agaribacter marinus TaxID=1431249 RepID=A0AA37SYH0_9ALTE|nr:chloride channel protein [Agaribacter marinus]GLR72342.1 chloride channel protein [Agaribacter marinus]
MSLQSLRQILSIPSTSIQLCLIGLAGGLMAATVVVVFRALIGLWQYSLIGNVGSYIETSDWNRLVLPIFAAFIIFFVARLTGFKHYRMGIPFVIHRLKIYYGHIPLRNSINQFIGGVLALGSGFVVGKEGPTVHLAAATSHYLGRWLHLPFNSLRILAGCGIAGGIAAAFNTPFAAIIFVMEVVLREYKVHIFIPVMLAAAVGSMVTRAVFGNVTELGFLSFEPISGVQLVYLIVFGICIGTAAALFNSQLMLLMRLFRRVGMFYRLILAGTVTGIMGYFFPESLGAEFISVDNLLSSDYAFSFLVYLFIAKFVLAIIAISLGIPGGIIGAVMVIGMLLGVILFEPLRGFYDTNLTTTYALLGLAGFLASVLHAPMAALSASMELAADSHVILPAIIVIVSAFLTSKQIFNNRSIFIRQLEYQGLPYTTSPIRDLLQQTGVLAAMNTKFKLVVSQEDDELKSLLQAEPNTIVLHQASKDVQKYKWMNLDYGLQTKEQTLSSQDVHLLTQQHTMADVHDALQDRRQGAVVILDLTVSSRDERQYMNIHELPEDLLQNTNLASSRVVGVITWNMLHSYLLRRQH